MKFFSFSILFFLALIFSFHTSFGNDPCSAIVILPPPDSCLYFQGTTVGASGSSVGSMPCSAVNNKPDYWYKIIVPACGPDLTFQVLGGSGAGQLSIGTLYLYNGSCTGLTDLGCTTLSSPTYLASITLTHLTPGDTIFIRIRDFISSGSYMFCAYGSCPTLIQPVIPFLEKALSVFPNPAGNEIFIQGDFNSYQSIEIIDALGKSVSTFQLIPGISHAVGLDISSLAAGMYWVRLKTNDNFKMKKLFVKTR